MADILASQISISANTISTQLYAVRAAGARGAVHLAPLASSIADDDDFLACLESV